MELSKLVNQLQEIAHLGYAMCNIEVRIVNPEADVIIENPTITPQVINNEKVRLVLTKEN